MKTRILLYGFTATAVLIGVALFCSSPNDPRTDPGNAMIKSVLNFKDTVPVGIICRCTVSLQLPELIDSVIVMKKTGAVYTRYKVTASDSLVPCSFGFSKSDIKKDTMLFIIKKQNGENDTLKKPILAKSVHIRLQNICTVAGTISHCNPWFDTIWADTCAYDLDSAYYPNHFARNLSWLPDVDTIDGGTFRMVKLYSTFCLPLPPYTCTTFWNHRWVIEHSVDGLYLCSWTGIDTLVWGAEDDSLNLDAKLLIIKRGTSCP